MNRQDLSYALRAVLPHCGKTAQNEIVGIEFREGVTYAYATDAYTIGIARIVEGAADIDIRLPKAEAADLEMFIRPRLVGQRIEELAFNTSRPGEFHVGFADESEVYETSDDHTLTLSYLFDYIDRLLALPVDWTDAIYQPKLAEKFAKATRTETDRLRILPRRVIDRNGAAVVMVGADFIGAISGLTYDEIGSATVADFLGAGSNATRACA